MTDKTIYINYNKEKRNLISKIKNFALNKKGIIFGGLVRDEIIATHYRKEFTNKHLNFEHYWNIEYDPDTIGRTLIPNDIDIYFKDGNIVNEFLDDIKEFIKLFNGFIEIKEFSNSRNFKAFQYVNPHLNLIHTKVFIEINIGKTISYAGIRLKLDIDIISNNMTLITDNYSFEKYTSYLEPPFYNLDFLSNIFVMDKSTGLTSIRASNCTGTPIDNMNIINKNKFINNVLTDIINFRTQFVRSVSSVYDCEFINCFRIIKMIDRGDYFSWNITNVPFSPFNSTELKDDNEYSCCICLENICDDNFQHLISINTNEKTKNILHKNCFVSYLKAEQQKKYRNSLNVIEIRCPFRNPFNFKDCYKKISYL